MLSLESAPATKLISDANAYAHLKVEASPEDETLIQIYRDAAEAHLDGSKGILSRALITQTWKLHLPGFPTVLNHHHCDYRIPIPLPPLQSITSINYVDTDGVTQTLSSSLYQVIKNGTSPGAIVPAYGKTWPSTRNMPEAVEITFVCGYGAADTDVPANIRAAALLIMEDLYSNRSAQEVGVSIAPNKTVDRLLAPYRIVSFG